jgi:hypothetical protein
MFTCEPVDLDYLESAPLRLCLCASINVDRPPSEVFAAFAHDPANWGEFSPASTELALITRRGHTASALAAQSG